MSDTQLSHARAHVSTPNASRYLQQLCKHFGHKIPTEFDAEKGRIEFPFGTCALKAEGETLTLDVAGQPDELERLKSVVDSHLVRFAFREALEVTWLA